MLLARRAITPRRADFAGNEHFGMRLKVELPEDANRIERLKLRSLIGMFESGHQIKSLDDRMVIGRTQPDDLGITCRRFRKKVSIRSHEVRQLHFRLVGIPARAQYMPFEISGPGVVRL